MRIISKKYLTESEIKEWLGLTTDQLDRLRLEGKLPFIRVNKLSRMYPLKEVEI
jgi:DNA-binding Xre family transcriptional regulator